MGHALAIAAQALASSEDKQRAIPLCGFCDPVARSATNSTNKGILPRSALLWLGPTKSEGSCLIEIGKMLNTASANQKNCCSRRLTQDHPLVPDYHRLLAAVDYSRGLSCFLANRKPRRLGDGNSDLFQQHHSLRRTD